MKIRALLLLYFTGLSYFACDDDQQIEENDNNIEYFSPYIGTDLYDDDDCSGADIQYATFNRNQITLFDYLGDNCDDTVNCYSSEIYDIEQINQDSFYILSNEKLSSIFLSIAKRPPYLFAPSCLTASLSLSINSLSFPSEIKEKALLPSCASILLSSG